MLSLIGLMLSLIGLNEVKAHLGRELGVSDWRLVTQENLTHSRG